MHWDNIITAGISVITIIGFMRWDISRMEKRWEELDKKWEGLDKRWFSLFKDFHSLDKDVERLKAKS